MPQGTSRDGVKTSINVRPLWAHQILVDGHSGDNVRRPGTQLHFGSAVIPVKSAKTGGLTLGLVSML